ncbi:class I SAM-dependent methyltransferase [Nocardia sp. BMG51109]|uniref:class I SAM-dependent methyltransferase n=1 Tax=Nocardia sp. BMG51109 TaxID=1056816 RepID=UPI00046424CF|nr:class I SAM-dependent methyltransferase [Nocardia sp. BMG51109]
MVFVFASEWDDRFSMPRGGPRASRLNRLFETGRLEYTDRDDVPDHRKQQVVGGLDRGGERLGIHSKYARLALTLVAGVDRPRILELGAGHGRLSERILLFDQTARITVTDLDPGSVGRIAAGPLGRNPRVRTAVVDATAIDAPAHSYDLVVFVSGFHHLPPDAARRAIGEATRVGTKFLVVDAERPPTAALLCFPLILVMMVTLALRFAPISAVPALVHDAFISLLRSYSRSAYIALGKAAHPDIAVEFPHGRRLFEFLLPVVYSRAA